MEIIKDIEQGTPEWLAMRLGMVTASNFGAVLSKSTGRRTYLLKLASERLTGELGDFYTNAAMEWGTKTEPQARANYEMETGNIVEEVAFIRHSDFVGVSPDGLIGDDGLIEIKCPNTNTHIETVLSGKMPSKHKPQVQGQLWVSKRDWCDFVSFDPRIRNEEMRLFIHRVYRDDKYINDLSDKINTFVTELNEIIETFEGAK